MRDPRNPRTPARPATPPAEPLPPLPETPPGLVAHPPAGPREALEFLRNEGGEERRAEPRPNITIPGGEVTITESSENLFRAIAPSRQLFYRGGAVVELINEGDGHSIQILDEVAAQSRFEKYVRFVKPARAGQLVAPVPTNISKTTAEQYLNSEACRTLLPKLNGVLHCPLLVERDGRLHRVGQGYDEATGFFVATSRPIDTIQLPDAVELLTDLLNNFDFVTPADHSRAIASLLTPALKMGGLIRGPVPVDVAEANASQSGKTYRQRMIAALYNQKLAVVTKKAGGVGSMEEIFSDHLVKGHVFIQFDNVRGKLDSQFLESFLTAEGTFPARIPYHGAIAVDPSKFILFISSNGFEATGDLSNRASIIRIRKRENFQYRMIEGKDLVQLMFDWHPFLMGSVFAVVEEWHRRGKPTTNDTRHDFREWCQSLDWIVQNIFHAAPLMDGHQEAKQRAANPNLSFLRVVAIKLNERHRLGQEVTASDMAELCQEDDVEIPGLSAETQSTEQGPRQIGKILGALFESRRELTFDEFRVARRQEWSRSEGGNSVALNRYTFNLVTAVCPPEPPPAPTAPPAPPSGPPPAPDLPPTPPCPDTARPT